MICVLVFIIPIKYKYSTIQEGRANVAASMPTSQPEINPDLSVAPVFFPSNNEEMIDADPTPPFVAEYNDNESPAESSEISAPARIDDREIENDVLSSFAQLRIHDADIKEESRIDRKNSKKSNGPVLVDNGDDTLTNIETDLMWQKRITSSQLNWQNACNSCDHLNFAGYDDWRMPEAHEYFELVNDRGSTISRDFNNYSVQQWTMTNYPKRNNYMMTVEFEYFIKYKGFLPRPVPAFKNAKHFVRCVR